MSSNHDSEVAAFYAGKSVFLTGGTGFLGKALIEKLLYSCNGINKIYVLVRAGDEKEARERFMEIINTPVFLRLKTSRSKDLDKIIPVAGDITSPGLKLPIHVLKTLEEEVSVVFHCAATVKFNLPLKEALNINVGGTHEVIQLCRRMAKLQAFVHVSTAFSNSNRYEVEEVVYSMPIPLVATKRMTELYSDGEEVINLIMGKMPNTYTFSKAYAEELVQNECIDIPAAIVRPSIVISSLREPTPGWIDSWGGAAGLFMGMPSGTLKVVMGKGTNVTDLVPVDIVTNLLIVVATKCHHGFNHHETDINLDSKKRRNSASSFAVKRGEKQKSKGLKVYNCCTGTSNPITCDGCGNIARRLTSKYSLNDMPMPMFLFTPNRLLYQILTFFLQIIPACIIDLFSLLTGGRIRQMKIQDNLKKVVDAVKFFLLNEWKFSDSNVRDLFTSLPAKDKEIFNFDVTTINWETCLRDLIFGCRKYLMKINDSDKIRLMNKQNNTTL